MSFQEKLRKLFEKEESERMVRKEKEKQVQQGVQEEASRMERMILELRKTLSQEIAPILEMVNTVYLKRKGTLKIDVDARAKDRGFDAFRELSQGICYLEWDVKTISYAYRSGNRLAIVVKFDGSIYVEAGNYGRRIEGAALSLTKENWKEEVENIIINAISTGKTWYEDTQKEPLMY